MDTVAQLRQALQSMFSGCCDAAAREVPVIRRKRVFSASSLARTFILGLFENPNADSESLAAMAARCDAPVTKQAVEKRYTAVTARFFECLFQKCTCLVVQSQDSLAPILERFTEVILADSSSINLPDSQAQRYKGRGGSHGFGKSGLKLQTELDLRSGRLETVEVTSGSDADVAWDGQFKVRPKGTLRITDLGYFSAEAFLHMMAMGCFFLSRLHRTMRISIDGVDQGIVIDYLVSQRNTLVDQFIHAGIRNKLPCRLIAWKVPQKIAERRRRKVRAEYKRRNRGTPPAKALAACDWTMLVTNLRPDELTVNEAAVLYRARWQIELLFKRWKSIGQAIVHPNRSDEVELVRFWARLCGVLLQHWLCVACCYRKQPPLSFARVAKLAPKIAVQMAASLRDGHIKLSEPIETIIRQFQSSTAKSARRDTRAKDIGTIELLKNPEKLDWGLS